MTDYEKLAKCLREISDLLTVLVYVADKTNEAADAIEELVTELVTMKQDSHKWISAEERLPKEEIKSYWCYTDAGAMCECRWTKNPFGIGESDSWRWNIMDVPQYQKVTHWMHLPEPPKEEA